MRHFRQCIHGAEKASPGGAEGVALMEMLEGIYKSAGSGKSVAL
jgi:predicted dehydrogenase